MLAGLDGLDNDEELVLECFDDRGQVDPRLFSAGATSEERLSKVLGVAIGGTTEPSDILVHSFDRIAVYSRSFFSRDIPVCTCICAKLSVDLCPQAYLTSDTG